MAALFLTLQDPVSNPGRNNCFYCGKKKPRGRGEGKQEYILLRQITKSPPMPLILHPLQSDITGYQSLSLSLSSPLLFIAATQRTPQIDRSMYTQLLSMAQMLPFFPFSQQHASTTDGELLRHETWRVRLTNWGMEGKEKSITKFHAAELGSIRLDGAVPRAKC